MEIKTPLSPGEFFDKFTILVNKVYCCENKEDVMWAMIGLVELAAAAKQVMSQSDWEQIALPLTELRDANIVLWELENQLRRRAPTDIEGIASDSVDIRNKNADRWDEKDSINDLLLGTMEVKEHD